MRALWDLASVTLPVGWRLMLRETHETDIAQLYEARVEDERGTVRHIFRSATPEWVLQMVVDEYKPVLLGEREVQR